MTSKINTGVDSKDIRKIIHVDMDAYYAAIEQRDNPQYRNKPIVVGSSSRRGVVATASYEARKYGIHSAMPSAVAKQKCSNLIFVQPRFDVYEKVSQKIREIFCEYTNQVEPLSLDEAYLNVTQNKKDMDSATYIAQEIRNKIKQKTGLTASAGVSINKFVAKVASDQDKPNGLTVITPDQVETFIKSLPIQKFYGIGDVTAKKMKKLGIYTGEDLKQYDLSELLKLFGKNGLYYYQIAHGKDPRKVKTSSIRKSIGTERTFDRDIKDENLLLDKLNTINHKLWKKLNKKNIKGRTVTLKVRFHDFDTRTRSKTISRYIRQEQETYQLAKNLLLDSNLPDKSIRLLGITLSNLNTSSENQRGVQLCLDF